jgi:phosphatidylinositol alpha-1,6-mannosyltransferase
MVPSHLPDMAANMRVLALVTEAYGGRGGIACAARDVLEAMARDTRISAIHVLPRIATDPVLGLPIKIRQLKAVGSRLGYSLKSLLTLTQPWDVIFCNHVYMAPLGALVARFSGAKLVIQVHGIEVWGQIRGLRRAALEAADWIVSVSRDTRSRILNECDLAREKVLVIPNTVSEAFVPVDHDVARAKFGVTKYPVLLAVGRLSAQEQYKGHDRVIRALKTLLPNHPNILFLVAGDGDDRARLDSLATQEGVSGQIRFLGQVPQQDLNDLYNAADLFALPSTGEGFGIVFLEAMAAGTPAIGLAVAGAKDALADGDLGFCVSQDGFATTLNKILSQIKDAPAASRDALAREVHQRFGKPVFEASISNLLTRIAA